MGDKLKKVLIVDDIKINRMLLKEIFKDNYSVLEAGDGMQALEMVRKHNRDIAVIILDIIMPKLDGYSVIKALKSNEEYRDIPIIVVTAFSSVDNEVKALDMGATDLIVKPFESKVILQRVKNIVQKKEVEKLQLENTLLKEKTQAQIQLQAIVENIQGGVVLIEIGRQYKLLYINKGFYDIVKYSKDSYEKFIGDFTRNIYPDDKAKFIQAVVKSIEDNIPINIEFRIINGKQKITWVSCNGEVIKYPDSKNPVILLTMSDKTELKNTSEELADTSLQLRTLIDNVPGGIVMFEVGESVELVFYNDSLLDIIGYTKEEVDNIYVNKPLALVHPDDIELLRYNIRKSINKHSLAQISFRLLRSNNTNCWVRMNASKIYTNDYKTVFYAVLIDTTKEKETEHEINEAYAKLKYNADHDSLTGIYSSEAFYRETKEMLLSRPEEKFMVIRFNIERFKVINDLYGSNMGDLILKKYAAGLKSQLTGKGTYGRLSSDHFVICMPRNLFSINRLTDAIESASDGFGNNMNIVVDAGIYEIEDINLPISIMCDRANLALQTINGNYLKRYAYYQDEQWQALIEEEDLLAAMEESIKNNEFYIVIQPIYSQTINAPTSGEALVRWNHPKKGIISPSKFIPIFEKNGFISKLDWYVWDKVCEYLSERKSQNKKILPISMNMSRLSLKNTRLIEDINELVAKYNIEPQYIRFEITESAYIDDPELLLKTVLELQECGFKVLMDDFGSGYSSLNLLKDLPIDILKIDMKFLGNLETSYRAGNILSSVIRMARWLKLPTIAEGVETRAQVDFLNSIGCDKIQGYFYSRPLSLEDYDNLLSNNDVDSNLLSNTISLDNNLSAIFDGNGLINSVFNGVADGIGIYELYNNKLEVIRVNRNYYTILNRSIDTLSQSGDDILESLRQSDRDAIIEACKTAVATDATQILTIEGANNSFNDKPLELQIKCLGYGLNNPIICIFIKFIETSAAKYVTDRLRSLETVVENLSRFIPGGVYCYDLTEERLEYVSDYLAKMCGFDTNEDFREFYGNDFSKFIYEEDRERALNEQKSQIEKGSFCQVEFRLKRIDGSLKWINNVGHLIIDEKGHQWLYVIVTDISIEKTILDTMMDNVPVGMGVYEIDDKITPIYVSAKTCDIFGYSKDEYYEFVNHFSQSKNFQAYIDYLKDKNSSQFEKNIQLKRKNNSVLWLRICGAVKESIDNKKLCYIVMTDITDAILDDEDNIRHNELYKLLLEESQMIIFDYNLIRKTLDYSVMQDDKTRVNFHEEVFTFKDIEELLFDNENFNEVIAEIKYARNHIYKSKIEFQAIFDDMPKCWYRCHFKSIADNEGKITRFIGRIYNINNEIQYAIALKQRAEQDVMSGVLNRATIAEKIENILCQKSENQDYAFFLLDIDLFKEVNDKYGHPIGDDAIRAVANVIKNELGNGDLAGRMGGDEFAIFFKSDNDKVNVYEKADTIMDNIRALNLEFAIDMKLSISMGITFTSPKNKDFKSLFNNADKALYRAKNQGRNRYCVEEI